MAEYSWPSKEDSRLIGKRHTRLDGLAKSTGAARYTYDVNLPNQLIVKALGSPHAHCKVMSVDVSAAEKTPGVVHVHVLRMPKKGDDGVMVYPEIQTEGELIVAVAAESEGAAAEGVSKIKVQYEQLPVFADDDDLDAAIKAGRTKRAGGKITLEKEPGDDEDEEEFEEKEIARLFKESAHVVEGHYGIDVITHCCLEPHGSTVEWKGGKLNAYLSTQNVSKTDDGFAAALDLTADDVDVHCEYIGGGFGSKFRPDYWGIAAAEISKATGRPVKFMLTRDQELKIAGNRPSGYINVKLGADKDGVVQIWDSQQWGTSGYDGGGVSDSVIPYVYRPKNYRRVATSIAVNADPQRAWRAPNHPQACAMTQTAYDDLAAKMQVDSLDIFLKNLANIEARQTAEVYTEELKLAAQLMDWKAKWHPHGKGPRKGSVVDGLGIGLHEWGGVANSSSVLLRVHADGGVSSYCGTQDLGTGTRTVCAIVLAETFGLDIDDVKVNIGHSTYPESGASGGSTTVGAVSESHRRAATDALARLFEKVAPALGAQPGDLEAKKGRIQVKGSPSKSLSWKEACSKLGMSTIEITTNYERGNKTNLSSEGVGGVQMAHVSVDLETGAVRVNKVVAVQDMGLIINRKAAESQIYGAVIMSIAYALFEQRIMDPKTGAFLNAELSDYKLPRLGDIGEIVVEMYEPESQRSRGVIGLGEPPVISGGAAISNAVCNATGVRVPVLPLTPQRVLKALG
ncbi:xanthine dehydrogenase family protein molybdopterin-binding subunit [Lignipirellula cremea]|uniref:Xanthine dehydrogenase molybdenum-binding subunit n=1 Tax=Lignipirellula cremea TaxID=2528010 RepID=A0A518DTG4_9BACT|nr:xanthine dehydrogenase family protein molybdopterin-binding subunit [Lignipirellula cremea]QDU95088.1 Xanthine dehydrogenase molybdenum-binding subunit [Lignipirellula cremea]